MGDTLGEVESALVAVEQIGQMALPELEAAFPQILPFVPFLDLFKVAIQGVDIVHQVTGAGLAGSKQAVKDTVTPGQPSAAALQ